MQLKAVISLAFVASTVFAHPHVDPEPSLHDRGTSKQLCTTLELPTEEQYKMGYSSFCSTYMVTEPDKRRMDVNSDPVVATFMLKTHIGTTIPWIFKISVAAWGGGAYFLNREACFAGFRNYLEGEKAKLGSNYCVVDGTGGNGASKGFSGQGFVLVMGSTMTFEGRGEINNGFKYETRRRNGDFDPNKPDGK